jgi:hypothetical protein
MESNLLLSIYPRAHDTDPGRAQQDLLTRRTLGLDIVTLLRTGPHVGEDLYTMSLKNHGALSNGLPVFVSSRC